MTRAILSLILLLSTTSCASTPDEADPAAQAAIETAPKLDGMDLYGSDQVTLAAVYTKFGPVIQRFAEANLTGLTNEANTALVEFRQGMNLMGNFAYVDLAIVSYYPPKPGNYLTIDLVDEVDRSRRMNFTPRPTYSYPDPGGLLKTWEKYSETAHKLLQQGQIQFPVPCPAYHCTSGFAHPSLAKYGEIFNRQVPRHEAMLYRILNGERDDGRRANAAFLLAHSKNLNKLIANLTKRIYDESPLVRNNAMRVLTNIGFTHPTAKLPLMDILQALEFPGTTDRNKALAVLASLSQREEYKQTIINRSGPQLVRILRLLQPNNHDFAYTILRNLSGQNFGEHDYELWENWLMQACETCRARAASSAAPGRGR